MPRPPRVEFPGAIYHVTSRGNGRRQIFFGEDDRERFLDQLSRTLADFDVTLYAFVLMPNHYHLLVRTRQANLSRFMQRLNTSYALYCRYKHKRPGHQLEGRYKAKLVQDDEYALNLTRYIHLNPVKIRAMQGVDDEERARVLAEYRWSSYPGYIHGNQQKEWVSYDILQRLDKTRTRARRAYRAYVYAYLTKNDEDLLEVIKTNRYGIGEGEFLYDLIAKVTAKRSGDPKDRDMDYPRVRASIERMDEIVARECGTTPEGLRQHGGRSKAGRPKVLAIELACRWSGLTQRAIGKRYGGITSQAVSMVRRRLRESNLSRELPRLEAIVKTELHVTV